MINLSAKINYN